MLEWDPQWRRVSDVEWGIIVGAGLTSASVRLFAPSPEPATWKGGIGFDEPLYDAVAPRRYWVWRAIANVSHVGFFGAITYRLVEDLAIVGGAFDSWDVATQMLGLDLAALSFIATTLWIPQIWIARQRPSLQNCDDPTRVANKCGKNPERNRSFWSGHPAVATAYAGLTCTHHRKLAIYSDTGGRIACGAMIANAAITGITRTIAGYHWASDVLFGFVAGTIAWLLPTAFHYGPGNYEPAMAATPALSSSRPHWTRVSLW